MRTFADQTIMEPDFLFCKGVIEKLNNNIAISEQEYEEYKRILGAMDQSKRNKLMYLLEKLED